MTAGSRVGAGEPDRLVEQRAYLLGALRELEAAYEASEVDQADYQIEHNDLTARAAAAIRALEEPPPEQVGRGWMSRQTWLIIGGLAVAALLAFVLVVAASDSRDSGDMAAGDVPDSAAGLLAHAEACLAAGDLECAREAYDDVLDIDPANLEAITYKGAVLFQEGDPAGALALFDEAIEADATYLDAWGFKIVVLDDLGRVDEAMDDVAGLVDAGDDDIALAVAGMIGSGDQVVLSLRVYDAILEVDPDNAVALTYRGWMVSLAGLDDEAMEYLDRAIVADPELPDALVFRAIVLNRLGRSEAAADALRAFDALDPPPAMQQLIEATDLREELGVPAPS